VPFDLTSFLIQSSVIVCGIAGFGSVVVILRRVVNRESIFFSLVLIGLTLYVIFYSFLKIEELKYLSYPLQSVAIELCIFGLFMFSYSGKSEGNISKELIFLIAWFLAIPPLLNFMFLPFTFVVEPYGYELQIETWFIVIFALINVIFFIYSIYYLYTLGFQSSSLKIRKKIKILILALLIDALATLSFLYFIPVIFQIHNIKPIGYYILSASMILKSYAFKREND